MVINDPRHSAQISQKQDEHHKSTVHHVPKCISYYKAIWWRPERHIVFMIT